MDEFLGVFIIGHFVPVVLQKPNPENFSKYIDNQ